LHVVGDGETAIRFPRRTDDFAGLPRLALVVLTSLMSAANRLAVRFWSPGMTCP
jgi:hypothetical protein